MGSETSYVEALALFINFIVHYLLHNINRIANYSIIGFFQVYQGIDLFMNSLTGQSYAKLNEWLTYYFIG